MNEKSLRKLEYPKIIEMLKAYCGSSIGKGLADNLLPSKDINIVSGWQNETTEARDIIRLNPTFSLGGIRDIYQAITLAKKGGQLSPSSLLEVQSTLRAARRVKNSLAQIKEDYPLIKSKGNELKFYNSIETAIENSIYDDGSILDSASQELSSIRRQMRITGDRVREKLNGLIHNPSTAKYLQDPIITIRNDRFVVPVKQEYRQQIPGLIHDQSASGATLFIEPMTVLDLNNDLKRLKSGEEEEISKILYRLSGMIGAATDDIKYTVDVLAQLDFIFAKGHLSTAWDGCSPKLNEEGYIKLNRARHPLLGKGAVPIDIEMSRDLMGIIITGPNTGGKTVSLKMVGLGILMTQAGLHLPAGDHCHMAVFRAVYADIGDEQSIEQSLSTFSSHMVNIVEILSKAGHNDFVVFDELGAGTDPLEGAALAMAIIDHLLSRGTKLMVSTHYSELKGYAFNNDKLANASVEFNVETLKPTYRLLMGIPGRSNAFDIAGSLGLRDSIIQKAGEYMSKEAKEVASFLDNLEFNRLETERAKVEASSIKERMEMLEREIRLREQRLEEKEQSIINNARDRADRMIREKKREADAMMAELKALLTDEEMAKKQEVLDKARTKTKKIDSMIPKLAEQSYSGEGLKKAQLGEDVFVPKLSKNGRITAILSDTEVQVEVGIMKVNMKLSDLRGISKPKSDKKGSVKYGKMSQVKTSTISSELDLRGMTAMEAIAELDKYIDDAFIANLRTVRIIHGLGTGVLKKEVVSHVKKHKLVREYRQGGYHEGGAGVTILEINTD